MKYQAFLATVLLMSLCSFAQQKQIVTAKDAPKAVGPYSQAVKAGGFVFTAGQLPLDPVSGLLTGTDVATQTERVLKNLQAVLTAAGASMDDVVKTTVYLKNFGDFAAMNEVYGRYFKGNPPARATVEVSNLAKNAIVEIDAVAVLPGGKH